MFQRTPSMPARYAELRTRGLSPCDILRPPLGNLPTPQHTAMLRDAAAQSGDDHLAAFEHAEFVDTLAQLVGSIIISGDIGMGANRLADTALAGLQTHDPEIAECSRARWVKSREALAQPNRPALTLAGLNASETPAADILAHLRAHGCTVQLAAPGRVAICGARANLDAALSGDAEHAISQFWWSLPDVIREMTALKVAKAAAGLEGEARETGFLRAMSWHNDNARAVAFFSSPEQSLTLSEARGKAGACPYDEPYPEGADVAFFPN